MARHISARSLEGPLAALPALGHLLLLFEAAVVALAWAVWALLPAARASALGALLLRSVGPRLAKHRHVRRNLGMVLPDAPQERLEEAARASWGGLGAFLAELPHLGRIARRADRHLEVVSEYDPAWLLARTPVVFVAPHLGNWEVTTIAAARLGFPLAVVYKPSPNPWIARMIDFMRPQVGCTYRRRSGSIREMLRALQAGTSIGLVTDSRQDDGEAIPFFGADAPTTTVPARLALRFGVPVVPVHAKRIAPARFRVTLEAPLWGDSKAEDQKQEARDLTRRIHACFEAAIRATPDQWMCTKRRWPRAAYRLP